VTAILVTHSHRDHSAGARALAAETGAPVMAFGPHGAGMSEGMRGLAAREGADLGGGEGADAAFAPDVALADGETVAGEGWRIEALHTPGHLSNHLSFLLHGADGAPLAVFTGDTVMGWATTLVSPPEGDMRQLMASLRLLAALGAPVFLPGHGAPVTDPAAHVARQAAHRVARRDAIRAALAEGPATPAELTRRIYTDVDPAMWPAAERNVLATLIWLAEEGLARAEGPVGRAARFAAA
jgi:hydroxyacylglutathione hydrolase